MKYLILQNEETTTYIIGRQKICVLICGCFLLCFWLLLYVVWEQDINLIRASFSFKHDEKKEVSTGGMKIHDEFLILQKGCRIPGMSLFGPSVTKYLEIVEPTFCEYRKLTKKDQQEPQWLPPLVIGTKNELSVNKSALKFYGKKQIFCTYRSFHRKNVSKTNCSTAGTAVDDNTQYSDEIRVLNINGSTIINSESDEFIEVTCYDKGKATINKNNNRNFFYQDYFAFVPPKKDVEQRCNTFEEDSNIDRISVMIIGLDALSRLNFHRRMNSSSAYLHQKMEAIEMLGYNKIDDNTFPNLIPALAGLSVDELKKVCWSSNGVFDECPIIWKQFREYGYRTVYAEDSPFIGAFNYFKKGFCQQPTDYYLRPFYIEAEKNIGFKKPANCYLCLGSRLNLSVLLHYALKHAETWQQNKFFGFFWSTSFTHDYFNLSPQGDEALLEFLKCFHENSGVFNNTVLVVMSDHGLRWGEFRETYQGHLEERLPLLTFVFPPWFLHKYKRAVENLRRNSNMLTTHYDLHDTLFDLMNLTRIENVEVGNRKIIENSRSQSLFTPVKGTRTCSVAGIPKNYCTCHDKVETLAVDDPRSIQAADFLVAHINYLLKNHKECAELALKTIEQVSIELSTMGGQFLANRTVSNLMIIVKLVPGNGLFEANVRYEPYSSTYQVIGQVSRINTYGSQSFCIRDYLLKLYCYCKF